MSKYLNEEQLSDLHSDITRSDGLSLGLVGRLVTYAYRVGSNNVIIALYKMYVCTYVHTYARGHAYHDYTACRIKRPAKRLSKFILFLTTYIILYFLLNVINQSFYHSLCEFNFSGVLYMAIFCTYLFHTQWTIRYKVWYKIYLMICTRFINIYNK